MGDPTTHGAPLAPGPGSLNVMIGNMPAWLALQDQHACPAVSITGPDGVGMVMMGSPTVLINNMMACRMGDIVVEIPGLAMGPANPIMMGCMTVMIGEVGIGSSSAASASTMASMGAALGAPTSSAAQSLATSSQNSVGVVPLAGGGGSVLGSAIGSSGDNSSGSSSGKKQVWVEIQLLDQFNKPVPNEPYSIVLPDGTVSEGSTDDTGLARIDGIEDPGNCQISFTSLDARSWKQK